MRLTLNQGTNGGYGYSVNENSSGSFSHTQTDDTIDQTYSYTDTSATNYTMTGKCATSAGSYIVTETGADTITTIETADTQRHLHAEPNCDRQLHTDRDRNAFFGSLQRISGGDGHNKSARSGQQHPRNVHAEYFGWRRIQFVRNWRDDDARNGNEAFSLTRPQMS